MRVIQYAPFLIWEGRSLWSCRRRVNKLVEWGVYSLRSLQHGTYPAERLDGKHASSLGFGSAGPAWRRDLILLSLIYTHFDALA